MSRGSRWAAWVVILGAIAWSAVETEVSLSRMIEGLPFMWDFLRRMVPPDLSVLGNALRGPVEAVRATGATTLQVLRWGVLPQHMPQFLSFTLYRFETNIRAAAVLGFVGAGGIGFYIQTYLRLLNYPAAATVLLVLIGLVMIVDFASSRLRAHLV